MNTKRQAGARGTMLGAALALGLMTACDGNNEYEKMVAVGDSLTAGVQTGVSFYLTQPNSYAVHVAYKTTDDADDQFEMPLLTLPLPAQLHPLGGRQRIDGELRTRNLGVPGAKVADLLEPLATATSNGQLRNEFDRVLFPRTGSIVDAAVAEDPDLIVLWIGNNDALGSVTNVGQIDGVSGLTPVDEFRADFSQVVSRLKGTGADMVVANIPPVSAIAYLLPGSIFGLPAVVKVPLPIAAGLLTGALPPEVLAVPGNLLTPDEEAAITAHVTALNQAIAAVAAENDVAVVDINAAFANIQRTQPITIGPFRASLHYAPAFSPTGTSGLFSLDGVHPSNTGYAILANEFVRVVNQEFDHDFPEVNVFDIAATDPYLDNDGDGCIEGPGFFSVAGVTGDTNDANPGTFQCRPAGSKPFAGGLGLPMASPLGSGSAWAEGVQP